jgi:hypothetical protein
MGTIPQEHIAKPSIAVSSENMSLGFVKTQTVISP